jgi:predicted N-acyltransferase
MLRHTVQFHWTNQAYASFDDFLDSLSQEKRKKIRQERRKVTEAGVTFRRLHGADIAEGDWDFFYRCYERTYLEHGNAPYLSRDFFARMATHMPENWVLFMAERAGQPVASSLIAIDSIRTSSPVQGAGGEAAATTESGSDGTRTAAAAYGRYWGALERVDCLHFEACYYQPLAHRASTKWREPCCRSKPPAPTGWPTRLLPTR